MLFLLKIGLIVALSAKQRLKQCFVCLKQALSVLFKLKKGLISAFWSQILDKMSSTSVGKIALDYPCNFEENCS